MLYSGFLAAGNICIGATAYLMGILTMKKETESLFDFCNTCYIERGCMWQPGHLPILLDLKKNENYFVKIASIISDFC